MVISYRSAWLVGFAAICAVVAVQAFGSFACYHHDWPTFLSFTAFFVLVPLIPALIALLTRNPLCALGGCLLFVPWLVYAYYFNCVRLGSGGGDSMVYVQLLLYGAGSCLLGVLFTALLMWLLKVQVVKQKDMI